MIRPSSLALALTAGPLAFSSPTAAREVDSHEAALAQNIALSGDLPLLYQSTADGEWVLGHTYKAHAGSHGVSFIPMLGAEAPQNFPVEFKLVSASVGEALIELLPVPAPERNDKRWTLRRGPVDVRYDLGLDSMEQSFRVDTGALRGDLVLRLQTTSELTPSVDGDGGFVFSGEYGGVTFGRSTAFDAQGSRCDVAATLEESTIVLTVPAAFVASARGEVIVDPLLQSFWVGDFIGDEQRSDVAYEQSTDSFLFAYERTFSGNDGDILLKRHAVDGTELSSQPVDISGQNWRRPSVASLNGDDKVLIAANAITGSGPRIVGRMYDAPTNLLAPTFVIVDSGVNSTTPFDLGGSSALTSGAHFAITWVHRFSADFEQIRVRLIAADESLSTALARDTTTNGNRDDVSISKSTGNPFQLDAWNIAYYTEDFATGAKAIRGFQFSSAGNVISGPSDLQSGLQYSVVQLDVSDALETGGSDPTYIVAYEDGVPFERGIEIIVCEGSSRVNSFDLRDREHRGGAFSQHDPHVATTASDFLVTYMHRTSAGEEPTLTALDLIAGVEMGISEQATALGSPVDVSPTRRGGVSIASRFSGGNFASRYSATCWSRYESSTSIGATRATVHAATNERATGIQYCQSTLNSSGERGFLTLYGPPSATTQKLAVASNLPPNQFGFLSSATAIGDVPGAGGSAGVLCIGGTTGRYINQVLNSGPQGVVETIVDPTQIPSGGAYVPAMAGQLWFFQFWHRDVVGGSQTSNFTNAVIYFVQ